MGGLAHVSWCFVTIPRLPCCPPDKRCCGHVGGRPAAQCCVEVLGFGEDNQFSPE
jgi:hypothetical protein